MKLDLILSYLFGILCLYNWIKLIITGHYIWPIVQYFAFGGLVTIFLLLTDNKQHTEKTYWKLLILWWPAIFIQEVHDYIFRRTF